MSGLGTAIYRGVAKVAALHLSALDSVSSVYVRRSVACGEAAFGRSDIDVHVLIHPHANPEAEARALIRLADRWSRLRRLFPMLGDCDVSTPAELHRWYQLHPFTWYRDRGWLKLSGAEFIRPQVPLQSEAGRESLLWWFFWAWERLPQFFRAGNVHTCRNLFLDMANVFFLYTGTFSEPKNRAEVFQRWRTISPAFRDFTRLFCQHWWSGAAVNRQLTRLLYRESLTLCRMLAAQVGRKLHVTTGGTPVHCAVPFTFAARTYVIVEPPRSEQIGQALALMEQDPTVFVTTAEALAFYWYHRNPWEYYTVRDTSLLAPFSPPPEEALRNSTRIASTREIPRRVGCALGRKVRSSGAVSLRYAQHRLYADQGVIASGAGELQRQYQRCYGAWPYTGTDSRTTYFSHDYPLLCESIDEVRSRLQ
jgi:predicted nucleotidyltransferase